MLRWWMSLVGGLLLVQAASAQPNADPSRDEVVAAMKKAVTYYREKVASHGGYVYYYSLDLAQRWGEGKAPHDTIFIQPPGTPAVGLAYLEAFAATGDRYYLEAARDAGLALAQAQQGSGGWTQSYRFEATAGGGAAQKRKDGISSLDDGQTQTAIRCLVAVDRALEFNDDRIHQAATTGLAALLDAQFPCGAFPQVWRGPVELQPVVARAKFPDYDWRTEGRIKEYWNFYTLNDGLVGTVLDTLIAAHETYGDAKYSAAIEKLGDFLLAAQMPEPQPGWCQQYNYDMVPIWARKFEPPAVSGWESQDAMRTLIRISQHLREPKYLEPVPRGLEYLKKSLLPDGRIPRFLELQTNRPLYMDANYQLTYDDADVPPHYGWKQPANLADIERLYLDAKNHTATTSPVSELLDAQVKRIIGELDAEGRWISEFAGERLVGQPKFPAGFKYLSSDVFNRNLEALSFYLKVRHPRR